MNLNHRIPTAVALAGLLMLGLMSSVNAEEAVPVINVTSARDMVSSNDDAIIIDVRTPIEFQMSHVTGAVNVDVQDETFWDNAAELDKNKTYIVHCTKNPEGGRSSRALTTLQSLGFKNLYSMEGGYIAWQEAELPLTENSE
jgi:rhodanese-related sulfurtransferase